MIETPALLALAGMALVTYGCRAGGYAFMRQRAPGGRLTRFLDAAPKTMFVALITPTLARGGIEEWLAAAAAAIIMLGSGQVLLAMVGASLVLATLRALLPMLA